MSDTPVPAEEADRGLRDAERLDGRVRYENQLLLSRLTAILQVNGLASIAAKVGNTSLYWFNVTLAAIFIVVNSVWIYSSLDS